LYHPKSSFNLFKSLIIPHESSRKLLKSSFDPVLKIEEKTHPSLSQSNPQHDQIAEILKKDSQTDKKSIYSPLSTLEEEKLTIDAPKNNVCTKGLPLEPQQVILYSYYTIKIIYCSN